MNDYVYFKLTPVGIKIWEDKNRKLEEEFPIYELSIPYMKNEWVREQLWELFQLFGHYASAGSDVCIHSVTFECPPELLEETK